MMLYQILQKKKSKYQISLKTFPTKNFDFKLTIHLDVQNK